MVKNWFLDFFPGSSKNGRKMVEKWSKNGPPGRPRPFFDHFLTNFQPFFNHFSNKQKNPTGVGGRRPPTPVGWRPKAAFLFFSKMVENGRKMVKKWSKNGLGLPGDHFLTIFQPFFDHFWRNPEKIQKPFFDHFFRFWIFGPLGGQGFHKAPRLDWNGQD